MSGTRLYDRWSEMDVKVKMSTEHCDPARKDVLPTLYNGEPLKNEWVDLMKKCFTFQPEKRPTAQQLIPMFKVLISELD